jgi:hypothetical protein
MDTAWERSNVGDDVWQGVRTRLVPQMALWRLAQALAQALTGNRAGKWAQRGRSDD